MDTDIEKSITELVGCLVTQLSFSRVAGAIAYLSG